MQVQDHRNNSTISQASLNTANRDKNVPFSIHNYNEHLTPSPYVPYPHPTASDSGGNKSGPSKVESDATPAEPEKEKHPTLEQPNGSTSKNPSKGPRSHFTVLFPTPMSTQEEVLLYANTPDIRSNNRKQSQNVGRTPTSATLPQPPTPLSAVPPTPSFPGPPAKRQKMMVSSNDVPAFEGKIVAATATPLYLDPVDNLQDTQKVLRILQDPLFQNKPPAPKTRKRTVAELAADEALAEEEQRFMLIMDERLVPSANAAAGNTAAADGESGAASFEPRFERFKALEEIKFNHQEKARREQEAKAIQQVNAKAKQEQQDREARQMHEAKIREVQRQEQMRQQFQMKREHALQQQQMTAASNQHSHPPTSNGMMTNAQQLAVSQAHHSSPVARNLTPHNNNSSPLVGNMMIGHSGQSMPMTMSTSSQGAGSPARPGSALQHAHPAVASAMNPQRSQQQPPSRNGTPQMPNGTPRLQQANTPVMRHVTPTPRMSHGSPALSAIAASTPVMGHSMMATPHMNGQQLTPQQQAIIQQRQQQQQAFVNQQHAMQNSPPNNQHNLQALAAHQAHQQNQARNPSNQEAYLRSLHSLAQARGVNPETQLSSKMALHHQQQQQAAAQAAAMALSQQQHHQQQQQQLHASQQQQSPQQLAQAQKFQAAVRNLAGTIYTRLLSAAQATQGPQLRPEILQQMKVQAMNQARQIVAADPNKVRLGLGAAQQAQAQAQAQFQMQHQQQQQQQQQQAMMNGGGMGGMGMGGMNGM